MSFAKGGGIHIKPENEGKLHQSMGVPEGKKIPLAALEKKKNSDNPVTAKRANFAINARKWHHG